MAEAPVNSGSSEAPSPATGEVTGTEAEVATTPDSEVVDDSGANAEASAANSNDLSATPSPAPSSKAAKEAIQAVLASPSAGGVFMSDAKSMVLVIDQNYAVFGENGLTASFTFNPTTSAVFSNVSVEVKIDTYSFEFKPTNTQLISGQNGIGLDVYILVGDATYIYDESGKKWSNSDLGKSRIKIEVVMEANGTTVHSIDLVMLAR
jgi:hypothetical protein